MIDKLRHKPLSSLAGAPPPLTLAEAPYDRQRLSYASTFTNPTQRITIQTIEYLTGKLRLLRKIRQFEAMGVPHGQAFWKQALDLIGIDLKTPQEQALLFGEFHCFLFTGFAYMYQHFNDNWRKSPQ